jgi:hypothetical protein
MTNGRWQRSLGNADWDRTMLIAPIVGGAALLLCIVGWIFSPTSFYPAYLCGWLFWLAISLGSLAIVMLHFQVGGEWGYFVRRFGEAASSVLPLLLILFIPVIIGTRVLYPWREGNPQHDNLIVVHRAPYFQLWLWILRFVIYLAVFMLLAFVLRRLSLRHDRSGDPRLLNRARMLSAPGMVFYFVLMGLAAVDWIMSRQPEWRSTMFGFIICMGQCTSGVAALIILLSLFRRISPFAERVTADHFNDLASLLITCVILWAYMAFGQLLIIWLGTQQNEISWYVPRSNGAWHVIAVLLIIFHFCIPFLLLLMRRIKRDPRIMLWLCAGLLVMRALDLFWITAPAGDAEDTRIPVLVALLTIASIIGIGGLWVAAFLWLLAGHPLMPLGDFVPLRTGEFPEHGLEEELSNRHGTRPGREPPAVA